MVQDTTQSAELQLPAGLLCPECAWPTVLVDTGSIDLRGLEAFTVQKVNDALYQAFEVVSSGVDAQQALVKTHIGESKCVTRMRPEYAESSVRFLRKNGVPGVVAGDTTVAYSGPRGHKNNPPANPSQYLALAKKQGWSPAGSAGIPFVVLDRVSTAIPGQFPFAGEEYRVELPRGAGAYTDFFLAGGFAAADFVINHAHLTLHGLAGVAGCVKSIAMGCSSLRGKLRMHQSLLPTFDAGLCSACGLCVENCPEAALEPAEDGSPPTVDCQSCIGCGECEAVCVQRAVELRGDDITDWQRGGSTFPLRMADYTMGLMAGRWDGTVHVLHMYNATERCDCLDERQEPLLGRDLGFLVGKNPFAMDFLSARVLADALPPNRREELAPMLRAAERTADYVSQAFGILSETPLDTVRIG